MKKLSLNLLIVSLFLFCCKKKQTLEDKFTLAREYYTGNALKFDGYYYYDYTTSNGVNNRDIYYLYRNGVLLYGGTPTLEHLAELESEYKNGAYYSSKKDSRPHWGQFKIENSTIRYERPGFSSGGPLQVGLFTGQILSDTSFVELSSERVNGENKRESYFVYKFKPFSPKPDSINQFIN